MSWIRSHRLSLRRMPTLLWLPANLSTLCSSHAQVIATVSGRPVKGLIRLPAGSPNPKEDLAWYWNPHGQCGSLNRAEEASSSVLCMCTSQSIVHHKNSSFD